MLSQIVKPISQGPLGLMYDIYPAICPQQPVLFPLPSTVYLLTLYPELCTTHSSSTEAFFDSRNLGAGCGEGGIHSFTEYRLCPPKPRRRRRNKNRAPALITHFSLSVSSSLNPFVSQSLSPSLSSSFIFEPLSFIFFYLFPFPVFQSIFLLLFSVFDHVFHIIDFR